MNELNDKEKRNKKIEEVITNPIPMGLRRLNDNIHIIGQKKILHEILNALFAIAYADEILHYKEEKMLIEISQIFKIKKEDYNRIKSIYDNKYNTDHQNLKKFYQLLGVSESDSLESIKNKYRNIIKEYHPDTIQGKGLPEEFINFANKKLVDFNEAYNEIKKHKEKKTL